MRNLDPKSLRLLVAVCDLKSIRKAAEQENIEPSAISKRIAQLESAVGTQLLVRGRRATQPTAAGQTLLEHARTMLFVMQRIKVDIEERLSRDLVRVVKDGGASLGACWDTVDFESLEHLPYGGDELAVAVPSSHPLARRHSVAFAQTLDFEHVGLPPTTAVNAMLQRVAVRSGRLVQYRVIVSSFDAAYRAVAAGLGISVLPRQLAPYYASAGLLSIPLSDPWAKRRFAICFRDLKSMPAPARRLVEHLAG